MVGWCESIFTPWVGYLRPMWSGSGMGGARFCGWKRLRRDLVRVTEKKGRDECVQEEGFDGVLSRELRAA